MKIGIRIKELRKEKGITLDELAKKSGVALATLSRMENNKMTGTVKSHKNICKVLGTSLAELYEAVEDEAKIIENISKKDRIEYFKSSPDAKHELLVTKTQNKKIIPVLLKLNANSETQKDTNDIGVEKFVYALEGNLDVVINGREYLLKQGDSLYFDASLEHYFRNSKAGAAKALYVMSSAD